MKTVIIIIIICFHHFRFVLGGNRTRPLKLQPPINVSPNCAKPTPIMADRLVGIRKEIERHSLNAYILLWTDEHQNENLSPSDEVIAYATNYKDPAVMLILTQKLAILFLEKKTLTIPLTIYKDMSCTILVSWIEGRWEHIDEAHELIKYGDPFGQLLKPLSGEVQMKKIGFYSKQVPVNIWKRWCEIFRQETGDDPEQVLVPLDEDIVRRRWNAEGDTGHHTIGGDRFRPRQIDNPIYNHALKFAGIPWSEKLDWLQKKLVAANVDALILTELDEIAWLLNLRGYEFPYDPLFKAYIVVDHIHIWFFNNSHLTSSAYQKLSKQVVFRNYSDNKEMGDVLKLIAIYPNVMITETTSYFIYSKLKKQSVKIVPISPVREKMMIKSKTETNGMKRANYHFAGILLERISYINQQVVNATEVNEYNAYVGIHYDIRSERLSEGSCHEVLTAFGVHTMDSNYVPTKDEHFLITSKELFRVEAGMHFA